MSLGRIFKRKQIIKMVSVQYCIWFIRIKCLTILDCFKIEETPFHPQKDIVTQSSSFNILTDWEIIDSS